MNPELLNVAMNDGSRQFAILPQSRGWNDLREHLSRLPGAKITEFVTDGVTEAWIDFAFREHAFTVNNQFGEYWFFVQRPDCPDAVLTEVVAHARKILTNSKKADAKAIQDAIRKALMQDWDPIGVKAVPQAQDEYDSYIGGVYRILASSRSEEELIEFLLSVETKHMGLSEQPDLRQRLRKIARRLLALNVTSPRGVHAGLPVISRYRLGMADAEMLVREAVRWLAEGRDSPALVKLAILESPLNPPVMADAAPLFEQACRELSIAIPTKDSAILQLIRLHLESIVSGARAPREGLHLLMQEVYFPHVDSEPVKKYVGDSRGLEHLISMYWGYDDLRERPDEVSFDGEYGKKAIAKADEHTRQLARDWLATHPQPGATK